jgi:hypothetical protein
MKPLLLIGPGSSIIDFIPPTDNYTILSFAGTFDWSINNDITPDYWTFLDPNSVILIQDKLNGSFLTKVKSKTTLIYNDFQGSSDFYKKGFSTSRGLTWNNNIFGKEILPKFKDKFKDILQLPSQVSINKLLSDSSKHCIVKHGPRPNICKFSCFIFPMIFYLFPQVKNIDVIGFGDYSKPRAYTNSSIDYHQYIQSFNIIYSQIKTHLKENNISINFLNKNSYYKKLEWKK